MKTLFVDVDNICYEGIKSGSLCNSMGMLKEISDYTSVEILEIYNAKDSNIDRNNKTKTFYSEIEGIKTTNIKYNSSAIKKFLENNSFDSVIITLFSVFLEKKDLDLLDLLKENCKKFVVNINDVLYVNYNQLNNEYAKQYKNILKDSTIISCSNFVRERVQQDLGVESKVVYPLTNISTQSAEKINNLITFINPIDLKGVKIFERVAEIMPDKQFLVVCGWQESAGYKPKTENVTVIPFQKDINKVWAQTGILLALSIVPEAYCRVVTEALLNNCDVIGFNIGGLKEASCGLGNIIDPIKNFGSIVYPNLKEKDIESKAKEISLIINKICAKQNNSRKQVLKFLKDNQAERKRIHGRIFNE